MPTQEAIKFMADVWASNLECQWYPWYCPEPPREKFQCGHCASDWDTLEELSDHVQGNHRFAW